MFKNHPTGLRVLFFTEMWERFAYYLMIGIFFLYMTDAERGGLAFGTGQANEIYGWFIAFVYFTPFIGGTLADEYLGYRRSVVLGGLLMAAGYLGIAWAPGLTLFYASLVVVVIGNGFFKPNISSMVGRLYDEGSPHKDSAYNIFYMGINIGAFVCNFVAAILRNRFGWSWAFTAAGVGLLLGVVIFAVGQPHLTRAGDRGAGGAVEAGVLGKLFGRIFLPALAAGGVVYAVFRSSNAAFAGAVVYLIGYFLVLRARASAAEKRPLGALLAIFAVSVTFWMIYGQNGNTLTLWTRDHTDRQAGAAAPVLQSLHMDEVAPDSYWDNVPEAERPAAGEKRVLISTELFQSINPGFIVLLTPLLVGFFEFLRRRRKEPSTPAKVSWGLLVTAGSAALMVLAVTLTHGGATKGSPFWLVGTYAMVTVGELCLSPMGLSLVSKLAPPRLTGMLMGGWFLSLSVGNKLAGVVGGLWERVPLVWIFVLDCGAALLAALVAALLVPWIRGVMEEHERGVAARAATE